jgi:lipoprotein-anchoring transpeptidase ErfK/SrfK
MRSIRRIVLILVTLWPALPANAEILMAVDKSVQRMVVVVDGSIRWVWPVSTGRRGYETPDGSYTVFWLDEDHYSEEWDDAPMPHSIFFTRRGHAVHGSYETKRLGTPASHGCVRLAPANAAKLFALVERAGIAKATVIVTSGDD